MKYMISSHLQSLSTPDLEKLDVPQPPSEAYPWTCSMQLGTCSLLVYSVPYPPCWPNQTLSPRSWALMNTEHLHPCHVRETWECGSLYSPYYFSAYKFSPNKFCVVLGTCDASDMCLWRSCTTWLVFEH